MSGKGFLVDCTGFGEGRDEGGNGSLEHATKLLRAGIHASAVFLGYNARTLLCRQGRDKPSIRAFMSVSRAFAARIFAFPVRFR
ncbi:hypothetical protein D3C87_1830350 [compost metagenome]